jgi:hypothetical protein
MAVTDAQVKVIVDTTVDTTPFIAVAEAIVTKHLLSKGIDSVLLDQIRLYLAAHFTALTVETGGYRRIKMGESDETYKTPGEKATGFAFTRFGQQAMILDYTGTLARISSGMGLKAEFEVVSAKDASE